MAHTNLTDLIKRVAKDTVSPDKSTYLSISIDDVKQISEKTNLPYGKVEIAALDSQIIPQRYARNMTTFSPKDQAKLLQASATVVGLGGLGGTVVELLARTGVGALNLIDGDVFEESNLNRQLLSSPEVLGRSKAETTVRHVHQINPSIKLSFHEKFINAENCQAMVKGSDVVVDCLDNLKTRFVLEETTKNLKIPLVYGAVGGHTGQVMVIFPEDSGLTKIYGQADDVPDKGIEVTLGTLPPVVFMVASAQCAEIIKILLGRKNILRNKLLIVDPFENIFQVLDM